jgi:aminocarboxymuconate-semialdehyde decarboxylase
MHEDCGAKHALPRRQVLQGGLATAAVGAVGAAGTTAAVTPRTAAAALASGARAIDIHAHYFPQAYLDVLGEEGEKYNLAYRKEADAFFLGPQRYETKFTDLTLRLADMDARGVQMHALSLTAPMLYFAEPAISQRLAVAWNDGASAAHQAHPERFVGLATLPMGDPDRAVDELNRASKLPGIRGVYLGTNIQNRDLDDPMFRPVFARIEALDLPVFLHPLKTIGGERLGVKPYYLNNLIGNPLDTAIACAHLIFGGVLDRYPKLDVCLPHSGGVMPILMGRWDHGTKVRPELKYMPRPPSEYLRRFSYDTVSHSKPIMQFVISQVGIDRIMLGSDYCFDMGDENPVEVVEALGLDSEQRELVLRDNAAKLLRVKV